jgi:hypothetical protein
MLCLVYTAGMGMGRREKENKWRRIRSKECRQMRIDSRCGPMSRNSTPRE